MGRETVANFHFRIVEVASMFLIPLLAIALAIPPKRSTSSLGVFLSIVILVTQHKINQYAEDLGARGTVDPILALWVPYLLFAALARSDERRGGQECVHPCTIPCSPS